MFAVAINETPDATIMVGESTSSSNLKYLCPSSKTDINMFHASGCALDNSSNNTTAFSVLIALTNADSSNIVAPSLK